MLTNHSHEGLLIGRLTMYASASDTFARELARICRARSQGFGYAPRIVFDGETSR